MESPEPLPDTPDSPTYIEITYKDEPVPTPVSENPFTSRDDTVELTVEINGDEKPVIEIPIKTNADEVVITKIIVVNEDGTESPVQLPPGGVSIYECHELGLLKHVQMTVEHIL